MDMMDVTQLASLLGHTLNSDAERLILTPPRKENLTSNLRVTSGLDSNFMKQQKRESISPTQCGHLIFVLDILFNISYLLSSDSNNFSVQLLWF